MQSSDNSTDDPEKEQLVAEAISLLKNPRPALAEMRGPTPFPGMDPEERLYEELLKKYDAAVCTLKQWEGEKIPKRKFLVGHWMREGDLGFLYGERGGGKTYFADALATRLSTGKDLFSWAIPEEADVMYVDGEMPQDDARDRLRGMSTNNPRIHVLHHDRLFDQCGGIMNLTQPVNQRVITSLLQEKEHQTPDPR